MNKHWKTTIIENSEVDALRAALGIHPILCKALIQRGVKTFESARGFFRYTVEDLHNPFLMQDMRQAVDRIDTALIANEKILIFGDYDVDGTTGVALLFRFLKKLGASADYYLPDRHKEGYGLSEAGVYHAQSIGAKLLITVDCGIKAIEKTKLAADLGIDVIICDHHLPFDNLPTAVAILDPLRPDCSYPFKGLSGAGVAFKLCQALAGHFGLEQSDLDDLLDLLCLSICCDIVPVIGENRILTQVGLQKINNNPSIGVKALLGQSRRNSPLAVSDVVYGLGPIINAAGRLGHAKNAVELLLNEDEGLAEKQAQYLAHQNRQRRIMDTSSTKDALQRLADSPNFDTTKTAVLYNPDWHKGILGILAARVAETYNRPTVVFTDSEYGLTGSARSVAGFDIYTSLLGCAAFFDSFGGHHHAAGIRMKKEKLEAFQSKFDEIVTKKIKKEHTEANIEVLGELALEDISPKFMAVYRQFAPFGPKNMRPVFVARKVRLYRAPNFLKDSHVQLSLAPIGQDNPISAIGFGLAPVLKSLQGGRIFDICYTIKEEYWKGEWRLKLQLKDIRKSEV